MFVRSNEENYLFLCLCLFVDYPTPKKSIRNSSLVSSSTIEEK